MATFLPYLEPWQMVIISAMLVAIAFVVLFVRRYRFIGSLKASVKFDVKKFAKSNKPVSSESDLLSIVLGLAYIPLLLFMFAPVLQLSLFMNLVIMTLSALLVIFGLFGQHMVIADSYSGKSNLLAIVRTLVGWHLVFMAKRYVRAIKMTPEKLAEIKEKDVEFSKNDPKLSKETEEFWKSPNFYPVLVQKYVDSMRDAAIVVTDIPWDIAVTEEPWSISAGIKNINISVGALMLSYTPAVEIMSSSEHQKYLKIDKVEVPIFTSLFSTLSAEAQKNLSAAALESMRVSEERSRRMDAEARANRLQRRLDEALTDRQIEKRQGENIELEGLETPEPKGRVEKIVKKHGVVIALGVAVFFAALFGVLWMLR